MTEEEARKATEPAEAPPAIAAIAAIAAIERILDRAATGGHDMAILVDLLRNAYTEGQWTSRQLTTILEQVAAEAEARG